MKFAVAAALLVELYLTHLPCASAQGPLTPPGAPAPTMKTLDQVEPRKPIDATNTPGNSANLFRITEPGSYYLTASVVGAAEKNGIAVDASDVTIDLRGFTLTGVPGSLDGIIVGLEFSRLTVRNGNIAGWGGDGVDEVENFSHDGIYENVRATGNGGDGLRLGDKAIVTACKLSGNSGIGMSVNGMATVTGCTVENNGVGGFYIGSGSLLDSVASGNGDAGFQSFGEPVLMKKCVSFENGTGFRISDGGKVAECIARFNFDGIEAHSYCTITDCMVKNNAKGIWVRGSCHVVGSLCEGNTVGVRIDGSKNLIKGNQAINGDTGILTQAGSINNLFLGNTAGNNAINNYDIVADNRYGPVVDITALGTAAVTGNSGGGTTVTGFPGANFAY
ncbi:MAG: NosD domain-containing protein [Chthoniobacteraceae bacterium]